MVQCDGLHVHGTKKCRLYILSYNIHSLILEPSHTAFLQPWKMGRPLQKKAVWEEKLP